MATCLLDCFVLEVSYIFNAPEVVWGELLVPVLHFLSVDKGEKGSVGKQIVT